MTNEEKQEIINAVLSAIMTNSKTIEQLTPTDSLSDNDEIEVSGGRRISYAAFLSAVKVGVQLMLDGYLTGEAAVAWFAALENNPANYVDAPNNPVQLHWRQSPIVLLDSMGEDLDGDSSFSPQVGDKWWDPTNSTTKNYIFLKTRTGQEGWPIGSSNVNGVLYVNKRTGRMYLWDGTDMVELVGATGGGSNVYIDKSGPNYVDIIIEDNAPVIEVSTQSIVMSGDNKTATFTVSGHNLTSAIRINGGNAYFSKSPSSISPVGGIVEATTVTVTFGGSTDDTDDLIVSSVGAASKTVHVTYTAVAGPNIVVSPTTLSFKAAEDETETKQVSVQGSQLEADVTVSSDDSAFEVSLDGTTFSSSVTIAKATATAGATVYVRYTAGSSASTGTLTLESTGATNKTVDLTGAVSTLTVSPSSLSFSTEAGTPATKTFTVRGANLTQDISISASGTGFSVSPATIDKDDAATEQTVTVTYSPSEAGTNTGSITLQSGGASATVTLEGTASAGLPTGYTKLTYLQGITRSFQSPAGQTYPQTWEFDVQCDALTSNIQILACSSSAGGKWVGASNNGKWGVGITDATCTTVQVTTRATVTATLKSTGVEITIGNETITRNADSALAGYVRLFGCNETDKRLFGGKVYGVRLVSGGTADLVLASRDSDGQQGIYNLTNNTFYGLT